MSKKRVSANIHGRVQGVGFRAATRRRALELGLAGWVANEADGSVRCLCEGDSEIVQELISFLKVGPRFARVDRVDMEDLEYRGDFDGFEIRS